MTLFSTNGITRNDGTHFWIEIKDAKNEFALWVKAIYFEEQYADEQLFTADAEWFKPNIEMLKKHIHDWEDF